MAAFRTRIWRPAVKNLKVLNRILGQHPNGGSDEHPDTNPPRHAHSDD